MIDSDFINQFNQCLESIDILGNTRDIETLKGRILLLSERYYFALKVYQNSPQKYIVLGARSFEFHINLWKKDPQIHPVFIHLMVNPSSEKLISFLSRIIYNSFERFYYKTKDEMSALKNATAIQKRKDLIIKNGYDFQYLYKFAQIPDDNNYIEKIEEFRKQFYYQKP